MKRFVPVVLLCAAASLVGYTVSSRMAVYAQETQNQESKTYVPLTLLEGKGMYWSADDLKKQVVPEKGPVLTSGGVKAETPIYRLNIWERDYYEPARMMPISKTMSHFDDGEMHEDKTQLYIIISGAGSVVLGGHAQTEHAHEGQHNGGPIIGGTSYRVKAGDWILIPPRTWHQVQPDPGQKIVLGMVHIQTETRAP